MIEMTAKQSNSTCAAQAKSTGILEWKVYGEANGGSRSDKDDTTTGDEDTTTGKDDTTIGKDDTTIGDEDTTTGKDDTTTGTIDKEDETEDNHLLIGIIKKIQQKINELQEQFDKLFKKFKL